jgi:branched-chain amino acid transport system substrate-binding protein
VLRKQSLLRNTVGLVSLLGLIAVSVTVQGAGAATTNDPGVTAKEITVGYIYSGTGVAGSTSKNGGKGFQARVDRQNAQGGVNGRKIKAILIDDQSSAANLTATQDLVQNRNAFVVVNDSAFAFLSYRYLLDNHVPMIGGGYDGAYYGQPGNESIFSALGSPFTGLTSDGAARIMKKLGASNVATVGYGASASSSAAAKTLQQYAVPALGLKAVYTNASVDFGTSDVGPLVLGMKNAGADAAYLPLVASSNFAIIQGLAQNGAKMKALVMPTGYGQDLLDSPIASTLGPEDVFVTAWAPVEVKTKATKQFQSDLTKYSGLAGVPDFGAYTGYVTAELAILGLQHAGATPTRQGFVDGLRALGTYDQAGLGCGPTDFSSAHYGKYSINGCTYTVTVKNGKFVVGNGGKPLPTKLVGDPAVIASSTFDAKNGSSSSSSTTTTTPTAPK